MKNPFNRSKDVLPVSVMVVSDDSQVLTHLNEILTSNGYKVYSIGDSKAAVSVLDEVDMPDVFIGDFINPGTDGKAFLEKVRIRFGRSVLPPVIFLMDTPEDEIAAQAMGVYDVLSKPIETEGVLQCIKALVEHTKPSTQ